MYKTAGRYQAKSPSSRPVKLGGQPVWLLLKWQLERKALAKLKYNLRRAKQKSKAGNPKPFRKSKSQLKKEKQIAEHELLKKMKEAEKSLQESEEQFVKIQKAWANEQESQNSAIERIEEQVNSEMRDLMHLDEQTFRQCAISKARHEIGRLPRHMRTHVQQYFETARWQQFVRS